MKVVLREYKKKTITVDKLDKHIVVANIDGEPFILTRERYMRGAYKFLSLNNLSKENNCMGGYVKMEDLLGTLIKRDHKVEAFEDKDWKSALKWLIDNC